MSMSTHIVGFRPPDETWKKMKAVWDACEKIDVEIPKSVMEFFGDEPPDEAGVEISLDPPYGQDAADGSVKRWSDDGRAGFEVDIPLLLANNPGLRILRVYNSW